MKLTYLCVFLFISSLASAQWYHRFDLEFGVNGSSAFNTGGIVDHLSPYFSVHIDEVNPILNWNYNTSIGFAFNNRHALRLRYSRFNTGFKMKATSVSSSDVLGMDVIRDWDRESRYQNRSYGLIYELSILDPWNGFIGVGGEYQTNEGQSEFLIVPNGIVFSTVSYLIYFGVRKSLFKKLEVGSKFFVIKAFDNKRYTYITGSTFAPISLGIELNLRFRNSNYKKNEM